MSMRVTPIVLACLLATVLLAPGVAADPDDGVYPCEGGYYVQLSKFQTECLPGLGYTGTGTCSGPTGPGTSIWIDGEEVVCIH